MKPYITFCIPSYNSEGFLHYALDSLISGENIEVLIIDDGSKDGTLKIAQEYEAKYPAIFKAVHQENKGHGGAINTALSMANGTYFKVLDSDDWVDEEALKACLDYIKTHNDEADLILMDYVYWQGREHRSTRIHFNHYFKPNEPLELKEVKHHFKIKDNITLHSAMYKTEVVRKSGVVLPEHCSYEDNLFVYSPLPYVDRIAYLPVGFYQYLIGRPGQSMTNEEGEVIVTKLDEEKAEQIAKAGKGTYIQGNATDAAEVLEETLAKLASTNLSQESFSKNDEQFPVFAWIALILLIANVILLNNKNPWLAKQDLFKFKAKNDEK